MRYMLNKCGIPGSSCLGVLAFDYPTQTGLLLQGTRTGSARYLESLKILDQKQKRRKKRSLETQGSWKI